MPSGDASLYLSTVQAAALLAVSVSTVKRWVDEGILPAHRTAGGHRKLLRAEVIALARQGNLPRGELPAPPSASSRRRSLDLQQASQDFWNALRAGHGEEASAAILHAYDSGVAIETLADTLVAPAMKRLGSDWEAARIDVWEEHRATQLCATALYNLKDRLESRAEKHRPLALGGAPEGDPYQLPSLLAQLVLLDAGWEAINLGPNTPLASLARAVTELRPRLLWLSVSYLASSADFASQYRSLYQVAEQHQVAVAIGGQAMRETLRASVPYTTYGDGLTHLAAFARTLHPRPRRPRRGRPHAS